ncbi:hypothetical protein HK096_000904 [Nowakowskiella sp. JEL0078]|nr:hypothetical protein HK096_000904 [Nowakowskiella sp. JEL0078]
MIMELCPEGDLWVFIQNGDITYTEANLYFGQLMSAVAYLHSVGVAHRDLKPENCMLDSNGTLKVADFGEALVLPCQCPKERIVICHGPYFYQNSKTPNKKKKKKKLIQAPYLAPEEFKSIRKEVSVDLCASDVWSCGIIYLVMIYSRVPWSKASVSSTSFRAFLKSRSYITTESYSLTDTTVNGDSCNINIVAPSTTSFNDNRASIFSSSLSPYSSYSSLSSVSNGNISMPQISPRIKFDMIDKLPENARRVIGHIILPNPSERWTAMEVLEDPWVKMNI